MAMGYTRSSTSSFPSVYVTGRLATDAPGTLQAETLVKAGEIAYTAFDGTARRWGDYTAMTIDPDGVTYWYLGEYSAITNNANGRWGTWINSFTYDSCAPAPDFSVEAIAGSRWPSARPPRRSSASISSPRSASTIR